MNVLAAYYVAQHLQELRDGAPQRPALPANRPSLPRRIVSAASGVRLTIATPLGNRARFIRNSAD